MKKLKLIVIAFLLGSIVAFVSFNKENKTYNANTVAFQLGVFKDEANAIRLKERLGGIVIKDADVYRVYYAILHDKDNIKYIESVLNKKGISYYIRNVKLDKTNFIKSDRYELLMNKSSKDKSKLKINSEMLIFYKEVL